MPHFRHPHHGHVHARLPSQCAPSPSLPQQACNKDAAAVMPTQRLLANTQTNPARGVTVEITATAVLTVQLHTAAALTQLHTQAATDPERQRTPLIM